MVHEARDEKLAPEEFGRRIDDGLVEAIGRLLPIEHGDNGIEEFKSRVRQIEEGMRENIALKAFAANLRENSKGPPGQRDVSPAGQTARSVRWETSPFL